MDTSLDTIVLAIGPRDDDRLDRLARVVRQVAKPTDVTVILTHVFSKKQFDEVAEELDYPKATEEDVDVVLERHQSIRHLEELFDEHDVRGVVGTVAESTNKIAETNDADRIVISGGDRSPAGKAIFGSTAQNVLLGSPCPVTYVRSQSK